METLILSANDQFARPQNGQPERAAPGLSNWQLNEYGYYSRLCQSSSDPCAIGGNYMPAVYVLPCGFHSTTEEQFFLMTSVAEWQTFRSNNTTYAIAPTWLYSDVFSKVDDESEGSRVLGMQGCRSASPVCGWTTRRIGNYQIAGQVVCRYSSGCSDGKKSVQAVHPKTNGFIATGCSHIVTGSLLKPFAKESPDTVGPALSLSTLQQPKPHILAGGVFCSNGGALKSFEPIHNRVANKVPRGGNGGVASEIGCNMSVAAAFEPYQSPNVREDHKKYVKESPSAGLLAASINNASLYSLGGQEEERYCICTSEGDPTATSISRTPLTVEGCAHESSQLALSPPMNERWAGPAFSNSPPPSSLPLPTFTRRRMRTSSLEIPETEVEFHADAGSILVPGLPSRSFSLPSVGTFQSHLDVNYATKSLRRLLNLDSDM
eukprot:c24749_g1_i2 orf=764-2065(+)